MADGSVQKQNTTTLSFPKLFTAFSFKSFASENETLASPISILGTITFSAFKTPFCSDNRKTHEPETRLKVDPKGIGLAILDETPEPSFSQPATRNVILGSQLRVRISPSDLGIKTRNSDLDSSKKPESPESGQENPGKTRVVSECLFPADMELSEDYTCVICHGPNPRTIHIFDNCVIESHYGVVGKSDQDKETRFGYDRPESFLSFCYTCKKNLGHGKDIFMYRGEKAFCSSECRFQEMTSEDKIHKLDF